MPPSAAPLCECCEAAPADLHGDDGRVLTDRDTGLRVCVCCFEWLYAAKQTLQSAGFTACEPLGPGPPISGGLGG